MIFLANFTHGVLISKETLPESGRFEQAGRMEGQAEREAELAEVLRGVAGGVAVSRWWSWSWS